MSLRRPGSRPWKLFGANQGRNKEERNRLRTFPPMEETDRQSNQTERRWRSVVENVPETILTISRDRRIDFINRTQDALEPELVVGRHYSEFVPESERPRVASHIESVFQTGQPTSYETQAHQPDGKLLGLYSCQVGPIWHEEQVESVVIIASNITERRQLDEELRHSRAQLRRLTTHQQNALEEERRRISRELHDELGQLLTALKIDMGWLELRLEDEAMASRLAAMTQIVDSAMGTVRRISSSLRPPLLDDLGPSAALDWLIQEVCTRAGLKCNLSTSLAGTPLSQDCSLAIFRICQEALTNVVRHAQASQVDVSLHLEGEQICLRISDDGVGISPDQLRRSLGLLGLQERVDQLKGQVSITGIAGQGTSLVATFPVE